MDAETAGGSKALRLISWNVNGLRACINKGFMGFFAQADADVFCVQENKMQPEQMPVEIPAGYEVYWNSANRKGYSGTTVFARRKPLSVVNGIDGQYNDEGRVITLEYPDFYLITSYTPNAQPELKRLDYRMAFEDALRGYMVRLNETKPVILCGDLNVAHEEIDIKNPKANVGKPGFSDEERAKMTELLAAGFTDSFRYLYPDLKDQYTWWSYRMKARERNTGWRIDYFIVSDSMRGRIKDSLIYKDVMGSDHCPIGLEIAE